MSAQIKVVPVVRAPSAAQIRAMASSSGALSESETEWAFTEAGLQAFAGAIAAPILELITLVEQADALSEREQFEKEMIKRHYPKELFEGFYAEGEWAYYDKSANLMEEAWNARAIITATRPVQHGPTGMDCCPITKRKFWGHIDHPELGMVATYGGPFDTFTIPTLGDDGELRSERFCQDRGEWIEGGEPVGWFSEEQKEAPVQAAPEGWQLVPAEPTPEIIAAAAIAAWPTASPTDIALARKAATIVLMSMDLAPGTTVEVVAAMLATMAPAYRAMLAAAPRLPLGFIDGKPVFVGDEYLWHDEQSFASPITRDFENCTWPPPAKAYPITQMRHDDMFSTYSAELRKRGYTSIQAETHGLAAVANGTLRHAIDSGQVISADEHKAVIAELHGKWAAQVSTTNKQRVDPDMAIAKAPR